ncbi:MAG: hypothetical protein U0Q16_19735 [Bryobacteraceae bacterium]
MTIRRTKRSFTLSPDAIVFLESLRVTRKAASVSSVLEEILQEARRDQERAMLDQATSDYYSSLTDIEVQEQSQWGAFALAQISVNEES